MCELLASCSKSKSAISSGTCVGMDTTHQAAASVSFLLLLLPLLVSCCSCHPLEQRAPEEDESTDQQGARWGLGVNSEESGCRMSWNQELWSEGKGLSPLCSLVVQLNLWVLQDSSCRPDTALFFRHANTK